MALLMNLHPPESLNQAVLPKRSIYPFKSPGHRITVELHQCICDLLSCGTYTNKEVAELFGLGKNVVKAIDKKRYQNLYTASDGSFNETGEVY